jgi:hypothetical protein
MLPVARVLIIIGLIFLVVGGLLYLTGRFGMPLGRLPGDIRIVRGNTTIFFSLGTSILLSLILTILFNIIIRYWRR